MPSHKIITHPVPNSAFEYIYAQLIFEEDTTSGELQFGVYDSNKYESPSPVNLRGIDINLDTMMIGHNIIKYPRGDISFTLPINPNITSHPNWPTIYNHLARHAQYDLTGSKDDIIIHGNESPIDLSDEKTLYFINSNIRGGAYCEIQYMGYGEGSVLSLDSGMLIGAMPALGITSGSITINSGISIDLGVLPNIDIVVHDNNSYFNRTFTVYVNIDRSIRPGDKIQLVTNDDANNNTYELILINGVTGDIKWHGALFGFQMSGNPAVDYYCFWFKINSVPPNCYYKYNTRPTTYRGTLTNINHVSDNITEDRSLMATYAPMNDLVNHRLPYMKLAHTTTQTGVLLKRSHEFTSAYATGDNMTLYTSLAYVDKNYVMDEYAVYDIKDTDDILIGFSIVSMHTSSLNTLNNAGICMLFDVNNRYVLYNGSVYKVTARHAHIDIGKRIAAKYALTDMFTMIVHYGSHEYVWSIALTSMVHMPTEVNCYHTIALSNDTYVTLTDYKMPGPVTYSDSYVFKKNDRLTAIVNHGTKEFMLYHNANQLLNFAYTGQLDVIENTGSLNWAIIGNNVRFVDNTETLYSNVVDIPNVYSIPFNSVNHTTYTCGLREYDFNVINQYNNGINGTQVVDKKSFRMIHPFTVGDYVSYFVVQRSQYELPPNQLACFTYDKSEESPGTGWYMNLISAVGVGISLIHEHSTYGYPYFRDPHEDTILLGNPVGTTYGDITYELCDRKTLLHPDARIVGYPDDSRTDALNVIKGLAISIPPPPATSFYSGMAVIKQTIIHGQYVTIDIHKSTYASAQRVGLGFFNNSVIDAFHAPTKPGWWYTDYPELSHTTGLMGSIDTSNSANTQFYYNGVLIAHTYITQTPFNLTGSHIIQFGIDANHNAEVLILDKYTNGILVHITIANADITSTPKHPCIYIDFLDRENAPNAYRVVKYGNTYLGNLLLTEFVSPNPTIYIDKDGNDVSFKDVNSLPVANFNIPSPYYIFCGYKYEGTSIRVYFYIYTKGGARVHGFSKLLTHNIENLTTKKYTLCYDSLYTHRVILCDIHDVKNIELPAGFNHYGWRYNEDQLTDTSISVNPYTYNKVIPDTMYRFNKLTSGEEYIVFVNKHMSYEYYRLMGDVLIFDIDGNMITDDVYKVAFSPIPQRKSIAPTIQVNTYTYDQLLIDMQGGLHASVFKIVDDMNADDLYMGLGPCNFVGYPVNGAVMNGQGYHALTFDASNDIVTFIRNNIELNYIVSPINTTQTISTGNTIPTIIEAGTHIAIYSSIAGNYMKMHILYFKPDGVCLLYASDIGTDTSHISPTVYMHPAIVTTGPSRIRLEKETTRVNQYTEVCRALIRKSSTQVHSITGVNAGAIDYDINNNVYDRANHDSIAQPYKYANMIGKVIDPALYNNIRELVIEDNTRIHIPDNTYLYGKPIFIGEPILFHNTNKYIEFDFYYSDTNKAINFYFYDTTLPKLINGGLSADFGMANTYNNTTFNMAIRPNRFLTSAGTTYYNNNQVIPNGSRVTLLINVNTYVISVYANNNFFVNFDMTSAGGFINTIVKMPTLPAQMVCVIEPMISVTLYKPNAVLYPRTGTYMLRDDSADTSAWQHKNTESVYSLDYNTKDDTLSIYVDNILSTRWNTSDMDMRDLHYYVTNDIHGYRLDEYTHNSLYDNLRAINDVFIDIDFDAYVNILTTKHMSLNDLLTDIHDTQGDIVNYLVNINDKHADNMNALSYANDVYNITRNNILPFNTYMPCEPSIPSVIYLNETLKDINVFVDIDISIKEELIKYNTIYNKQVSICSILDTYELENVNIITNISNTPAEIDRINLLEYSSIASSLSTLPQGIECSLIIDNTAVNQIAYYQSMLYNRVYPIIDRQTYEPIDLDDLINKSHLYINDYRNEYMEATSVLNNKLSNAPNLMEAEYNIIKYDSMLSSFTDINTLHTTLAMTYNAIDEVLHNVTQLSNASLHTRISNLNNEVLNMNMRVDYINSIVEDAHISKMTVIDNINAMQVNIEYINDTVYHYGHVLDILLNTSIEALR